MYKKNTLVKQIQNRVLQSKNCILRVLVYNWIYCILFNINRNWRVEGGEGGEVCLIKNKITMWNKNSSLKLNALSQAITSLFFSNFIFKFHLLYIYIIKQDIRICTCCVKPAKRVDRLGWIFLWTLMGGRGVLLAKTKLEFLIKQTQIPREPPGP